MGKRSSIKKVISHIGLILTLIISFSCSSTLSINSYTVRSPSSESITLPELSSEEDKLKVLLAIHKEIPELFSDAARFDIDLMKILDDQIALQKLLEGYPEFVKKWNKRQFIELNLTVDDKDGQVVQTKQIKAEALVQWKEKIKSIAQKIINDKSDPEAILRGYLSTQGKLTSGGFLNGLILNLPKELQAGARDLQKKGDEVLLADYLTKNLPATLVNFKSTPQEINLSKDFLIKKWKNLSIEEKEIGPLADMYLLMRNRGMTVRELFSFINFLDREDMENLNDPDYQKNGFSKITAQENTKTPAFYEKHVKGLMSQMEIVSTKVEDKYSLTIREQNPNIAIFRGCTGGDCSSQYSFPYPNDPNERVFFIYDKNKHLKGYISGTMVTSSEGKKSFYMITVSGTRLNTTDAELILQLMNREKAALGADSIIIPSLNTVDSLINFTPIKAAFTKAAENGKETGIVYNNHDIREQIERYTSDYNVGQYDHMERNASGVTYSTKAASKIDFKSSVVQLPASSKILATQDEIDMLAFWEFYQALIKSGRSEMALKALDTVTNSSQKAEVLKLIKIVLVKERVKTAEVNKAFDDFIETFDLDEVKAKKLRDSYAVNALLAATDAHQEPYKAKNLEKAMSEFKFSKNDTVIGRNATVLLEWTKEITEHPNFEKFRVVYIEMLKDESANIFELANDVRFKLALSKEIPAEYALPYQRIKYIAFHAPELISKDMVKSALVRARTLKDYELVNIMADRAFLKPEAGAWADLVADYFKLFEETGNYEFFRKILKKGFIKGHSVNYNDLLIPLIKTKDSVVWDSMIFEILTNSEAAASRREHLKLMLKIIDTSPELAKTYLGHISLRVSSTAINAGWKEEVLETIRLAGKYKDTDSIKYLINVVLGSEKTSDWNGLAETIIKVAKEMNSDDIFMTMTDYYFSKSHATPASAMEAIRFAIHSKNGKLLEKLDEALFRFKTRSPEWEPIKKMINGRTFPSSMDFEKLIVKVKEYDGVKELPASPLKAISNCHGAMKAFIK